MRKFLIVGCGGSGGATLRFMMDQLLADLRSHGIDELPPAWQFLQIDVPTVPEQGPGNLGSVRDLGGRYLSVSSPSNAYTLVANRVEQSLGVKSSLRNLAGWTPQPKEAAAHVPITNGAGQFRAIGRMLTLTDLSDIQSEMTRAWEQLQRPDAWGQLPAKYPSTYDPAATVVPIVLGSMAGGSGASMFLDICRLLGRLPGLNRSDLGVFLFTADVFASLPETQRTGVDGNALGALGEIIAAQTRASDRHDAEMFAALGVPPETVDEAAFARVFPIGSSIGGDGAKFGDGTMNGVYRGLGRALAATVSSEQATEQYIKSKIENPTPPAINRELLGWGTDSAIFPWGSFGYASLSLGRDRYAEYSSQRMARNAFDRLVGGHLDPRSQSPGNEQLNVLLDSQWATIVERLGFPAPGGNVMGWFNDVAFPSTVSDVETRLAIQEAVDMMGQEAPGMASAWVESIRVRLPHFQPNASNRIRESAYLWANTWATTLEKTTQEEFLRVMTQLGLPFAREVCKRLRNQLSPVVDELRRLSGEGIGQPLAMDADVAGRAAALKKSVIGAGHALSDLIAANYFTSAQRSLKRESSRLAAEVLHSYVNDVLGGLERAADHALQDLNMAQTTGATEAGLAQLATTVYSEWPQEADVAPTRFDHADNEVLLTTATEFPAQFKADVLASVPESGVYESARSQMVGEVLVGRWQTTGGARGYFDVVTQGVAWRPGILTVDPISKTPTPPSQPAYHLAIRPVDLLTRSREHLRRPDQPFEKFSGQTIEQFLGDPAQPESELQRRAEQFVSSFEATMRLARPLVGVSPSMVETMHPGSSVTYEYSFSDIPVSPSAPVVTRIHAMLVSNPNLDESTVDRFTKALKDSVSTNRIAMFGSYPKYSPLVFSSLLEQIQRRWAGAPEQALSDLWMWKRTRPLPASLAMNTAELRAMVGGWFLGRLLGTLRVPKATHSPNPVQIWDFTTSQWLAFPSRLLTPPNRFRGPDDWLPAVLESHTLAIVQCNNDVHLNALRPYLALRTTFDDDPEQPHGTFGNAVGVRRLGEWISTGVWPSGEPSEVLLDTALPAATPQERADAIKAWLTAAADYYSEVYLTAGGGVGALSERKARIASVAELTRAPMFSEIAEIVHRVLSDLQKDVDKAMAESGHAEGNTDVFRPVL